MIALFMPEQALPTPYQHSVSMLSSAHISKIFGKFLSPCVGHRQNDKTANPENVSTTKRQIAQLDVGSVKFVNFMEIAWQKTPASLPLSLSVVVVIAPRQVLG